ncbi:tRNA 2-thiouridine(34) synthase MnmA [Actinomyces provencensis]|uniref:tRNA 2-thiouridine(34) synthase MnmA n=1 Tax=Actinomyces provencensis TaxID=1720198 RepID=UPI0009900B8F|nr:tRNA 2-thiouridine(34) synthase MnmA [Actinomyces provencensis]
MRVLAALSGGVDSAVAAARAVAEGHEVVGVHMALSSEPQACRIGSRGCCSVEDAGDAARAAEVMGIPFYVWDLAEEFEETVITDFVEQYRAGHTPNPCVRCNEFVKFRELAERARALGFDAVCTGHYARIVTGPAGPELHRAVDEAKDQSYVLAVMGREELSRVLLPLGDAPSKAWVRAEAERLGLGVSAKPDSYDICFIPDGDTRGFLRRHLGEAPGAVVDTEGRVVGEHSGYWNFTVGQRRGLHLGDPAPDGQPRYVLETRPGTNTVVVGAATLLSVDTITCAAPVLVAGDDALEVDAAATAAFGVEMAGRRLCEVPQGVLTAQVRAHGTPSVVTGVRHGAAGLEVDLAAPVRGVAAGQSLVLYRGTRVLAEATITAARRRDVHSGHDTQWFGAGSAATAHAVAHRD